MSARIILTGVSIGLLIIAIVLVVLYSKSTTHSEALAISSLIFVGLASIIIPTTVGAWIMDHSPVHMRIPKMHLPNMHLPSKFSNLLHRTPKLQPMNLNIE
jgi:hypothetical protein